MIEMVTKLLRWAATWMLTKVAKYGRHNSSLTDKAKAKIGKGWGQEPKAKDLATKSRCISLKPTKSRGSWGPCLAGDVHRGGAVGARRPCSCSAFWAIDVCTWRLQPLQPMSYHKTSEDIRRSPKKLGTSIARLPAFLQVQRHRLWWFRLTAHGVHVLQSMSRIERNVAKPSVAPLCIPGMKTLPKNAKQTRSKIFLLGYRNLQIAYGIFCRDERMKNLFPNNKQEWYNIMSARKSFPYTRVLVHMYHVTMSTIQESSGEKLPSYRQMKSADQSVPATLQRSLIP